MIVLIGVGFLAGLITGISPCIVPVLPVIVAAGATSTDRRRPYAVVAGLVITFTAFTLVGMEVLEHAAPSLDFLYDAGLVLLIVLGVGLVLPRSSANGSSGRSQGSGPASSRRARAACCSGPASDSCSCRAQDRCSSRSTRSARRTGSVSRRLHDARLRGRGRYPASRARPVEQKGHGHIQGAQVPSTGRPKGLGSARPRCRRSRSGRDRSTGCRRSCPATRAPSRRRSRAPSQSRLNGARRKGQDEEVRSGSRERGSRPDELRARP